jgi:ATP-dependent phosphofructokinase / diphosphate-dependent phosphofructokinase
VHASKTIDNDLMENDHVPGFISAAAFVANARVSADLDFRAMPGIYVAIVMDRHARRTILSPMESSKGPNLSFP